MPLANELSGSFTETSTTEITALKDVRVKGDTFVEGTGTITEEVMVAGNLHVDGTITDDAASLVNQYCLHGKLVDTSASSDLYIAVPVTGKLIGVKVAVVTPGYTVGAATLVAYFNATNQPPFDVDALSPEGAVYSSAVFAQAVTTGGYVRLNVSVASTSATNLEVFFIMSRTS